MRRSRVTRAEIGVLAASATRLRVRMMDYIELTKPELTFLSVLTALAGFYIAVEGPFDAWLFFNTAIGTLLVGGGAGALNQYLEHRYDAEMKRTEKRPVPSGRIKPGDAFLFGLSLSVAGVVQVALLVNLVTGMLAVVTLATYLFLYTPLKRLTPLSTMVGAVPGALPAMAGWTAVRGDISSEAWILFGILYFWQMPHFYSLAWMYKRDYARAGYRLLTVLDERGRRTGAHVLIHMIILLFVSLLPALTGMTGVLYLVGAAASGLLFIFTGYSFLLSTDVDGEEQLARTNLFARKVFFASLLYIPVLILLMIVDKT